MKRIQHISCIINQINGKGAIYLGNVIAAQDITLLKSLRIRAILTCSIQTCFFSLLDLQYLPEDILFHKNLDAYDNANYDIIQHLQQSIQFIEKARQVTNIYVHCFAGVSRSVCCVTAYLMKKYKWSYSLAINFVKYKRQMANPNKGFTQQMMKYEYYLRDNRNNKEQKKYRKSLRLIRPYDLPGYLK